ncbi:hypothetical protein V8F06_010545 [Rhypophila decipiens]
MMEFQGGRERIGVGGENGETTTCPMFTASTDKLVTVQHNAYTNQDGAGGVQSGGASDVHSRAEACADSVVETSLERKHLDHACSISKNRLMTIDVHLELGQKTKTSSEKPLPDSPTCPSFVPSENDIELVYLAPPAPVGTYSTDELLSLSDESTAQSKDDPISHVYSGSSLAQAGDGPSYKPFALKWPFQALILALIAGFFALLEYEIRVLPDPNFTPLDLTRPGGGRDATTIGLDDDTTSTPTAGTPMTITPAAALPVQINVAAPVPEPDPRPPESAYPSPGPFTTYCGWGMLGWRVINVPAATPQPWAPWEASQFQFIDTFFTDNPSWCPCNTTGRLVSNRPWADPWASSKDWITADQSCHLVMDAIFTFNQRGRSRASTEVLRSTASPAQYVTADYAPNGDVLVPLTSMTVPAGLTAPAQDVYGYTVGPAPSSGIFLAIQAPPKQGLPEDVTGLPDIMWLTLKLTGGTKFMPTPTSASSMLATSSSTERPPDAPTPSVIGEQSTSIPSTTATSLSTSREPELTDVPFPSSTREQSSPALSTETPSKSTHISASIPKEPPTQKPSSTRQPTGPHSQLDSHILSLTMSSATSALHNSQAQSSEKTTLSKTVATTQPLVITSTRISTLPGQQSQVTTIVVITTVQTSTETGESSSTSRIVQVSSRPMKGEVTSHSRNVPRPISSAPTSLSAAQNVLAATDHTSFHDAGLTETSGLGMESSQTRKSVKATTITPIIRVVTYLDTKGVPVTTVTALPFTPLQIDDASARYRTWTTRPTPDPTMTESPCHGHDCLPDQNGPLLPSEPGPISPEAHGKFFNLRSEADYMAVSILPALLATLLGIPIQILVSSISSLLPFRALSRSTQGGMGVSARDSLLLPRSVGAGALNLQTPAVCYRFLRHQSDPLPLLMALLTLLATILIPLSSETLRLEYAPIGKCFSGDSCPIGLRKTEPCARAAEGILVAMAVILVTISGILARWWRRGQDSSRDGKFGMMTDPWSMASMTTLLASSQPKVRDLFRAIGAGPKSINIMTGKPRFGDKELQRALDQDGNTFVLGYYCPDHGNGGSTTATQCDERGGQCTLKYGISIVSKSMFDGAIIPSGARRDHDKDKHFDKGSIRLTTREIPPPKQSSTKTAEAVKSIFLKFWHTSDFELIIRLLFLILLVGLLILILYYEMILEDSSFERFMDSQSFGVRLLFTSLGTIVSLFWDYYFSYISEHQLFHRLATPQPAQQSILIPLPCSIFTSLWHFMSRIPSLRSSRVHISKHDIITFNVALATLLAKFTPILFSAIPFRNTVTWKMHEACTWMSVSFLVYMLLILLGTSLSLLPLSIPLSKLRRLSWRPRSKFADNTGGSNVSGTTVNNMPIRPPNTIASYMYYICDSAMVDDFGEGLEKARQKERDKLVVEMGKEYVFGEMVGVVSSEKRVGVDYANQGEIESQRQRARRA